MESDLPKRWTLRKVAIQKRSWRRLRDGLSVEICARRLGVSPLRALRLEALMVGQAGLFLNRKGRRLAVQNARHLAAIFKARAKGFDGPWSGVPGGARHIGEPRVARTAGWVDALIDDIQDGRVRRR